MQAIILTITWIMDFRKGILKKCLLLAMTFFTVYSFKGRLPNAAPRRSESFHIACTLNSHPAIQRAVSDYWGIVINVVTSDQHGWSVPFDP